MERIFPLLFGALFVLIFIGFWLDYRLYKMLELRHPSKYNEMGNPSLIMNNSISNNISFLKFLFKREYRELNDPAISRLSKVIVVFSVGYLIYFIGFVFMVFKGIHQG